MRSTMTLFSAVMPRVVTLPLPVRVPFKVEKPSCQFVFPFLHRTTSYIFAEQMKLNNIGRNLMVAGELEKAEQIFTQAVALNPKHFHLNYNLGCLSYILKKDLKITYHYFKTAQALAPLQLNSDDPIYSLPKKNYLKVLRQLIDREIKNNQLEEAHHYVDEIMDHEECVHYARLQKARIYRLQGKPDEAARWWDIATQNNPYLDDAALRGPDIL